LVFKGLAGPDTRRAVLGDEQPRSYLKTWVVFFNWYRVREVRMIGLKADKWFQRTAAGLLICLVVLVLVIGSAAAQAPGQAASPSVDGPGLPPVDATPEILSTLAGAALSLLFSYVPGLNTRFAELSPDIKRLVMAGMLLLTTAALYGLSCGGILQTGLTCDQPGLVRAIYTFFLALIANQSTYSISPQTSSVKSAITGKAG
jgi:hypothetical protein